jgi:hypothetical protein
MKPSPGQLWLAGQLVDSGDGAVAYFRGIWR